MEEAHKAVLKRKRVHNDDVIVPDKIRDCNITPILVWRSLCLSSISDP